MSNLLNLSEIHSAISIILTLSPYEEIITGKKMEMKKA